MTPEEEMYEIRCALDTIGGEGTIAAARRVTAERDLARAELTTIWQIVGCPREAGSLSSVRKLVEDRAGDEARKALGLILDELGQRPGDHLGALRALRAREGAGGKLAEVRNEVRALSNGHSTFADLTSFVDAMRAIVDR